MVVESTTSAELLLSTGLTQIVRDTLQRLILLVFGKSWLPDPDPVAGAFLAFFPVGVESSFAVAFAFSEIGRAHV